MSDQVRHLANECFPQGAFVRMGVLQNLDTEVGIDLFENPHSKSEFDGPWDGPKHQFGISSPLRFRDQSELRGQDGVEVAFRHRSEE